MNGIRELTLVGVIVRTLLATLLGGVIGMERGLKNRPAGLRTYMLVCLGSCLVMMTNQYIYQGIGNGDPTRMAAQVVSGIGFLGAGTIIVTSRNQIKGLTTAAGLWTSAAVGIAIGIGFYEAAVIGSVMMFIIMTILHEVDFRMRRKTRVVEAYVELKSRSSLGKFIRFVRRNNIETSNLQIENDSTQNNGGVSFIVTLKGLDKQSHEEIIRIVKQMDGLVHIESL